MSVKITDFCKSFGDRVIFDKFNFYAESSKITAILGGSGVGKTTLLNAIAGLESYSGNIAVDENVKSYVFQHSALIKGLTVYENLDFVLRGKSNRQKIMNALKDVELENYAKAYPSALSAGMAQRVSIARAFLTDADLILMDEPFRGLDVGVKNRLIKNFIELWQRHHQTVLFVTHSIEEAVLLADKLVILKHRPVQTDRTIELATPKENRAMSNAEVSSAYAECFEILSE